ncbi:MAG: 4-phosphoerythronate dehydrogenase [Bacteroidales bacterium]|nr:4-phosphoerythronate dehydrogenase [Bacteroidales bacterium]
MKVLIDIDIPFLAGVIEPYAEVAYMKGNEIKKSDLSDVNALIIRTRTICNRALLNGTPVKFIASATIGSDHVDLDYCRYNGIFFTNAAGCNAWGVVQHVMTALFTVSHLKNLQIMGSTVGIIGAGNVGERLAGTMEHFGFKVLRCDPPVKKMLETGSVSEKSVNQPERNHLSSADFHSMHDVIKASDIVTLHLPLDISTRGIFGQECFNIMKPGTIFINASRGEVLDEHALFAALGKLGALILDVWAGEPDINRKLLDAADIATPHIAGYSLEGKINATVFSVNSFGRFFGFSELADFKIDYPVSEELSSFDDMIEDTREWLFKLFYESYPIFDMDMKLRSDPGQFEQLRAKYEYRREISESLYHEISRKIK